MVSRDVAVFVCRSLAALDVLLVDEDLDALLDHADAGVEPGSRLADHLRERQRCYTTAACRKRAKTCGLLAVECLQLLSD